MPGLALCSTIIDPKLVGPIISRQSHLSTLIATHPLCPLSPPCNHTATVPNDKHACPDRPRTTGPPAARATTARLERLPGRRTPVPRAPTRTGQTSPLTRSAIPAPWVCIAVGAGRTRRTVPVRWDTTARCERLRRRTTLVPRELSRIRHRSTWRRSARTACLGTLSYDE